MTVGIIFSTTNGGSAIDSNVDFGSGSNGNTLTAQTIYIRHDGLNSITDVKTYIRAFSGSYNGDATTISDFAELLAWGNATTSVDFGGFQINMNASGSFPSSDWPTYSSKSPTNGRVFRTGVGDNSTNGITLLSTTGATSNGVIQAGSAPNVRFQIRLVIPSSEDTTGVRVAEQCISFNYTS